jgi:hypothetical protein
MAEGDKSAPLKNLPDPFPGFGRIGPRDSNEQEQIPLPPSPAVLEESADGHDDEEEEVEGDIAVEVDVEVEGKGEEEEEEEDINPWSSEEPSSFSGHASNSLSSLGQPIPSHYPFALCHQARGGSMPSTGSPPFASSHAGKSTSTRESHETRSTGNIETAFSSPSGGSPTLAASPTLSVPSAQDVVRDMPMPPLPAINVSTPLDSTKPCLPCTNGRSYGHRATINVRGAPSAAASEHRVGGPT